MKSHMHGVGALLSRGPGMPRSVPCSCPVTVLCSDGRGAGLLRPWAVLACPGRSPDCLCRLALSRRSSGLRNVWDIGVVGAGKTR